MFDVGFTELVLLFVIGLLILGPERLPRVASQLGRWVGRARRTANQLRHQLEREIALDDMARSRRKSTHAGDSAASSTRPGEPDPGAGPPAGGAEAPGEPDPGAEPPAGGEQGPAAADADEAAPTPGGTAAGSARDEARAAPAADDAAGTDAEGAGPPDRSSQA